MQPEHLRAAPGLSPRPQSRFTAAVFAHVCQNGSRPTDGLVPLFMRYVATLSCNGRLPRHISRIPAASKTDSRAPARMSKRIGVPTGRWPTL